MEKKKKKKMLKKMIHSLSLLPALGVGAPTIF